MVPPSRLPACMAAAALLLSIPAPAPAVDARSTAAEAVDPMTRLRDRLAEKLGATRAPDAVGTHEMRITSRVPAPPPGSAASAVKPKPAAATPAGR